MCRSIKQLRNAQQSASELEITEAALQYVRKISGYRKPSRANSAVFEAAVRDIAATTHRLLQELDLGNQAHGTSQPSE
jgi:hypothetical protein